MPRSDTQRNAVALTIAGSDPSGGAGLQADLKTFQELGIYGMSVVTLLTVQNTQGVTRVDVLSAELVEQQLDAVLSDIPPAAIKTGALGNAEIVECVGRRLQDWKRQHPECAIVVDPVLVSKHGHSLVTDDVAAAYRTFLLPIAAVVTPNRFEAEKLSGFNVRDRRSAQAAASELKRLGAENVLLKLGDIDGQSVHVLQTAAESLLIETPRQVTPHTHGTGCILAATITAGLTEPNADVVPTVRLSIEQTARAIFAAQPLGKGISPADIRCLDGNGPGSGQARQ